MVGETALVQLRALLFRLGLRALACGLLLGDPDALLGCVRLGCKLGGLVAVL